MRSFHKFAASTALVFASARVIAADPAANPASAVSETGPSRAPGPKSGDSPAREGTAKVKNEKPAKGRISLPLVEDHPSKGLKIPYYDGDGKLQMVFLIGVASRLNADEVEMSEMRVQSFDENGGPDLDIDLPASVYNLNDHVLTSKVHSTIKRQDFEISGDELEFNTDTKESHLEGNVRMLIYNLDAAVSSKPDDAGASANAAK